MQRRTFLSWCTACLLASLLPRRSAAALEADDAEPSGLHALVVGAGIAGLAAAAHLQQQGYRVHILEARNRVGGRLWTSQQWPDLPVDLGASWIHGIEGNPLSALADAAAAPRLTTFYEKSGFYQQGEVSAAQAAELATLRQQVKQAISKFQRQQDRSDAPTSQDLSVRQVIDQAFGPLSRAQQQQVDFVLSAEYEQEYGADAEALSARWFDSADEFAGDDQLFANGYQQLVQHIASGLTIRQNCVVSRVRQTENGMSVLTNQGEFTADAVIVTVPLGVLKAGAVVFEPPLPNVTTQAIASLQMGLLNKCYLRFAKPFWDTTQDWLEFQGERRGEFSEWLSLTRVTGKAVLLGFNAARSAHALEALTDQAIVERALAALSTMFAKPIPKPISYQITRWAQDPQAFGSYSYTPVGATPAHRDDLATPVGQLVFAGEACSRDYFGTVHGAYLSGIAAANQVQALLEDDR